MPDWLQLVRDRLSRLDLDSVEKEQVCAELAAHLSETYESLRREGLTHSKAEQIALAVAGDWENLRNEIRRVRLGEYDMTNRVTQLWLPGMLTFTVSIALEVFGQRLGPRPFFLHLEQGTPILPFYSGWLLTLPLAGAIGAYLSNRAGGTPRMMFAASAFPVLLYVAVFSIASPGLFMGHNLPLQIVAAVLLKMVLGWVLIPGLALLVGGLPIHFFTIRGVARS